MKIGVGITTYQRFSHFMCCVESLHRHSRDVDCCVVVEDFSQKDRELYDAFLSTNRTWLGVVRNSSNLGVGACKNIAMKMMMEDGCDYLFTIEDDVEILSADVFNKYIEVSQSTGFEYLNFGPPCAPNRNAGRFLSYCGCPIAVYPFVSGGFTFYTRNLIEKIGYHDETFFNAWEHYEYCYVAAKSGLTAPFWQFADVVDALDLLRVQEGSDEHSSISCRPDWQLNTEAGKKHFLKKHGIGVWDIPHSPLIGEPP